MPASWLHRHTLWLRSLLAFVLLAGGSLVVLLPSSASASGCDAGSGNPSTNNVTDYRLDSDTVAPDRWSYQNLTDENTPQPLVKGGSGVFAADEWVVDPAKAEHAWYVKSDGSIGTDWRPVAFAYTVGADQAGRTLRVHGTYTSGQGRLRILQSHDGSTTSISGPYTTLFSYTGTSTAFDLTVDAAAGDDLLFVSDQQSYWWVAGKLDATVVTQVHPQTQAVTATPDAGIVQKGARVTLATPTAGACISYTTDGTDPLTSATRTQYVGPLTVDADTEVKAAATLAGQEPSAVADLKYRLGEPFRQFVGIDQGPTSNATAGAQWGRMDLYWSAIEPSKGRIDQAALDRYKETVSTAARNGISMLPILDYTAPWAANRTGYTYTFHGRTFVYGPVTAESGDNLTRTLTTKDAAGKVIDSRTVSVPAGNTPPEHVEDWQNYVKLVVDQLEPLGVRYFQVWNEAYPGSGFWYGGMDQYMQLVHLPAAKIIHDAGGKVVYGGWICGAPVSEYVTLLDDTRAWRSVDVYDMHYMPLQAMQTLYDAARERGIPAPAVWQTEIGFTPEDGFVADVYPRAFHWALSKGRSLDQFKLFYFASWSPDDPNAFGYGRTLNSGGSLSPKGRTLTAFADLMRGSTAAAYDDFRTSPKLGPSLNELQSSADGFELDHKRIVVAVDLKRQNNADIFVDQTTGDTLHMSFGTPTVTVTFPNIADVASLDRVDLYGHRTALQWTRGPGHSVQVQVPVIDPDAGVDAINHKENQVVFYVELTKP